MSLENTYTPSKRMARPEPQETNYKPAHKATPSEQVRGWNCGFVEKALERARQRALDEDYEE